MSKPAGTCVVLGVAAMLSSAAPAEAQVGYLYPCYRFYGMPENYSLHLPVAVDVKPPSYYWLPEIHDVLGAGFYGRFSPNFRNPAYWQYSFGLEVFNGPDYPDPNTYVPAAGVVIVEYLNPAEYDCDYTVPGNLGTALPPTYAQARSAADAACAQLCGPGFVTTDFFYAQWQYACWYDVTTDLNAPRAYNFATWGGNRCQKPLGGNTYQDCPVSPGLATLAGCLTGPDAPYGIGCGSFDFEGSMSGGDGDFDLRDFALIQAQGSVGLGDTFAVMFNANGTAYDAVRNLTTVANNPNNADLTTLVEITRWNDVTVVNCDAPNADIGYLIEYDDPMNPSSIFQQFTDQYCTQKGASYCANGAISYVIDSCRRNPVTGVDTVRLGFGNCMVCY